MGYIVMLIKLDVQDEVVYVLLFARNGAGDIKGNSVRSYREICGKLNDGFLQQRNTYTLLEELARVLVEGRWPREGLVNDIIKQVGRLGTSSKPLGSNDSLQDTC